MTFTGAAATSCRASPILTMNPEDRLLADPPAYGGRELLHPSFSIFSIDRLNVSVSGDVKRAASW
jgi:hypothetical protein